MYNNIEYILSVNLFFLLKKQKKQSPLSPCQKKQPLSSRGGCIDYPTDRYQ